MLLGSSAALAYTVRPGDTLSSVAARHSLTLGQLSAANPQLRNPNALQVGQVLNIPGTQTHTVLRGESLSSIAGRYRVSLQALLAANPGTSVNRAIVPGQRLSIPRAGAGAAVTPTSLNAALWLWPAQGWISSNFGTRVIQGKSEFHDGIDIAAPHGSDVRSARAGRVIEARMDSRTGWGWTVLVDHGDGYSTRYAHLSAVSVRLGQAVVRGQVVGKVGNTGRSFGTHLHYGVYYQGRAVNPLLVRP